MSIKYYSIVSFLMANLVLVNAQDLTSGLFKKERISRAKIMKEYLPSDYLSEKDSIWVSVYKSTISFGGYSFYLCTTPYSSATIYYDVYVEQKGKGQIVKTFDKLLDIILKAIPEENADKAISLIQFYLDVPQFKGLQNPSPDKPNPTILKKKLSDSVEAIFELRSKIRPIFPIACERLNLDRYDSSELSDTLTLEKWQRLVYGQRVTSKRYDLFVEPQGNGRLSILQNELDGKYVYSFLATDKRGTRVYEMSSSLCQSKDSSGIEKTIIFNEIVREIVLSSDSLAAEGKYRLITEIRNMVQSFGMNSVNYR